MIKNKIVIIMVVLFGLLQLYPIEKPVLSNKNPNDLWGNKKDSTQISTLLKKACYDCHSNESKLPWYAYVAPSKWLVYDDINRAKKELNFSQWNSFDVDERVEFLDDISIVISENKMPLKKYLWLHSKAVLTKAEKEAIILWTENSIEALYK